MRLSTAKLSAAPRPAARRLEPESYREKFASYGHPRQPRVGACWHVNVARTSQATRERWEPRYRSYFELMKTVIRRVNPDPPPFVTKPFDFGFLTTRGPAIVGSPAGVVERLNTWSQLLSTDTSLIYIDMGGQPAGEYRDMVELIAPTSSRN